MEVTSGGIHPSSKVVGYSRHKRFTSREAATETATTLGPFNAFPYTSGYIHIVSLVSAITRATHSSDRRDFSSSKRLRRLERKWSKEIETTQQGLRTFAIQNENTGIPKLLILIRTRRDPLTQRFQPQSKNPRLVPRHWQKSNHNPKIPHPSLSKSIPKLALLINPPNRANLIRNPRTQSIANRVHQIRETRRENYQIELPFAALAENHFVFREALDVACLDFDLAVDDVLARAGVEVEATVAGLAESAVACPSLAAPGSEALRVESFEEGLVKVLESLCISTAKFFSWAHWSGEEDAIVLFGVTAVAGSIWGVAAKDARYGMR
jgi:hypothetical protein